MGQVKQSDAGLNALLSSPNKEKIQFPSQRKKINLKIKPQTFLGSEALNFGFQAQMIFSAEPPRCKAWLDSKVQRGGEGWAEASIWKMSPSLRWQRHSDHRRASPAPPVSREHSLGAPSSAPARPQCREEGTGEGGVRHLCSTAHPKRAVTSHPPRQPNPSCHPV